MAQKGRQGPRTVFARWTPDAPSFNKAPVYLRLRLVIRRYPGPVDKVYSASGLWSVTEDTAVASFYWLGQSPGTIDLVDWYVGLSLATPLPGNTLYVLLFLPSGGIAESSAWGSFWPFNPQAPILYTPDFGWTYSDPDDEVLSCEVEMVPWSETE